MQTCRLIAHPAHPPLAVCSVEARIGLADAGWLQLRWRVEGAKHLAIPPFAGRVRADGLWRTTCFELFCQPEGGAAQGENAYVELNFSPSERWAAYRFAARREGMAALAMRRAPIITPRRGGDVLICDTALRLDDLPPLPWSLALCAVLDEGESRLSYWALHHGGAAPDFHDPACFTGRLAPPVAP